MHTPPGGKGKVAAADGAKAPSVHDHIGRTPARERLHDTRGHAGDVDARNIINGRKYTPRRGGHFDPEHDRGESPEPPGTRVFSREIRTCNTRFIKGHKPSNYIRARIKSHVYTTE